MLVPYAKAVKEDSKVVERGLGLVRIVRGVVVLLFVSVRMMAVNVFREERVKKQFVSKGLCYQPEVAEK